MEAFPPRLPGKPIFYPVLNFEYAEQIARDWNSLGQGHAFFLTRFEVDDEWIGQFEVRTVGQKGLHEEVWIPAERLDEFNAHILGLITVETAYYGENFQGEIDPQTNLPVS